MVVPLFGPFTHIKGINFPQRMDVFVLEMAAKATVSSVGHDALDREIDVTSFTTNISGFSGPFNLTSQLTFGSQSPGNDSRPNGFGAAGFTDPGTQPTTITGNLLTKGVGWTNVQPFHTFDGVNTVWSNKSYFYLNLTYLRKTLGQTSLVVTGSVPIYTNSSTIATEVDFYAETFHKVVSFPQPDMSTTVVNGAAAAGLPTASQTGWAHLVCKPTATSTVVTFSTQFTVDTTALLPTVTSQPGGATNTYTHGSGSD